MSLPLVKRLHFATCSQGMPYHFSHPFFSECVQFLNETQKVFVMASSKLPSETDVFISVPVFCVNIMKVHLINI